MPLVDMPIGELRAYEGRNPRPADFDAFWDRSLAEMRSLDARIELVPAEFRAAGAECLDLWFTGVGGARIHAKVLRPKGAKKCPAVVLFHGYTMRAGEWHERLNWVQNGFVVAELDCRGQAGQSEDPGGVKGTTHHGHIIRGLDDSPEKLYYRSVFLDAAQLAGILLNLPEVDPRRVAAAGGSQGGGLTLACAALEPRIARAAPVYPFLCDYLRVWEMDLAAGAYAELKTFFKHFDPTHAREDAIFERLGYIDVQHLAPRIRAEILMGTGLMDTITPPSTQFAAFNKIVAPKEVVIYPDFGHEGLPGFGDRSFQWLAEMA